MNNINLIITTVVTSMVFGVFGLSINQTLITQKHEQHEATNKLTTDNFYHGHHTQHRVHRRHTYTIEELLEMGEFPNIISDDVDMDPCKSGGFMGDIALADVVYENEWRLQQYNKTFQQEIEKLKQEVLQEGLQVEEEGLTEILRKKTKQPPPDFQPNEQLNKKLNDPVVETSSNERVKIKSFKELPFLPQTKHEGPNLLINATIINNNENIQQIESDAMISTTTESKVVRNMSDLVRDIDKNKIQSNTKDIFISDTSSHIVTNSRKTIVAPTTAIPIFHQTSGNASDIAAIGDVTVLAGDGNVRKRHVRQRQGHRRNGSKDISFESRKKRLQSELERTSKPVTDSKITRQVSPLPAEKLSQNEKLLLKDLEKELYVTEISKIAEMHAQSRVTRAATAKKERVWDFGVIPYEIDGNFSGGHKALFKQAMRHWENFTCIKFVERNPADHPNYIVFTERPCGCCSFVGKRGNGPQAISIGKNCDKFGIVVHELGHVVGFWHEHTRPDRENHVVIEKVNIMQGQEYNFNKLTEEEVNSLDQPYDYDSIMHYARNTFSKGTYLDTILPVEMPGRLKRPEIGQRIRLSEGDIAQANLLYKCPKCGRTFQENSAAFTSPNYHNAISPSEPEKCEWRITATHGERIILNITDLHLLKSNNCRSDYLEIRDGYWHKSPVLGRFCGSGRVIELIKSTSSRMLLTYINNNHKKGMRGFSAHYEAVCGGEVNITDSGEYRLESPNYPLDYLANKECIWKITVPENYKVALRFQSFEVENHDNCVYDFVEIRDSLSSNANNSNLIGVFCGYKTPPDIKSSSNELYVKFTSDASVQKAGFSAIFMKETNECESKTHGCEQACINTLGSYECACFIGYELHSDKKSCENACGGVISDAPNGTILSPSFPNAYPILKQCVWEIVAQPNHTITLNFTHFDLEGNSFYLSSECEYDSVTIFSKKDDNITMHGTFCGSRTIPLITSVGDFLRIEFRSDKTIQKSGFSAVYVTDVDECLNENGGCMHFCLNTKGSYTCACKDGYVLTDGGKDCKEGGCQYEVTEPEGSIASPNHPGHYPKTEECNWHILTTPGHRIRLEFTTFDLESHQECFYDFVEVYDGGSPESKIMGKFCGTKTPHKITSNTNEMYLIFKSDHNVERKGFVALHSTVCGGRLEAIDTVKHFYSHAKYGDSMYPTSDCEWTIEAPQGRQVQLTFLAFEIESEKTCSYDYVKVFDRDDSYEIMKSGRDTDRYCGATIPPEIVSKDEILRVRFKTDDTMGFKGFSASYVAVDKHEESNDSVESIESRTPYPGSLKTTEIYSSSGDVEEEEDGDDDDDDEDDFTISSNYLDRNKSPETNQIKPDGFPSSEFID